MLLTEIAGKDFPKIPARSRLQPADRPGVLIEDDWREWVLDHARNDSGRLSNVGDVAGC
jgi:hypothetical protein